MSDTVDDPPDDGPGARHPFGVKTTVPTVDRPKVTTAPVGERSTDDIDDRLLPGYAGIIGIDSGGIIRYVSRVLDGRFGLAMADVVDRSFLDFVHESDVAQTIASFAGVTERAGHHQALEVRIVTARGERLVDVVADNQLDDPDVGLVLLSIADTDDRLRSARLLDAQADVVRQIALGESLEVAISQILSFVEGALPGFRTAAHFIDPTGGKNTSVSPTLPEGLRNRLGAAIRSNPAVPGAMALAGREIIIAADLTEPRWSGIASILGSHASCVWSVPIRYERSEPGLGCIEIYGPGAAHPRDEDWAILTLASRLAAVAHDRAVWHSRMTRDAEVDPLTGTPNRRVISSVLATLLAGPRLGNVVCFIDLDRLKVVNDGLGHEAGDIVIREAAQRLGAKVGSDGVLGRFGGDEFVAIASNPDIGPDSLAQRCLNAFAEPFFVAGRRWHLSASVGVVVIDEQRTAGEVLRDADAAMYEAKRAGRGCWRLFASSTRDSVVRRMRLEQQLRRAVERRQVDAWYQPVVRASDWAFHGLEVLARWRPTSNLWVPPNEFIPLAEELGLIDEIGDQMLDEAMLAIASLPAARFASGQVSVNVSPMQLQSEQIFAKISELSARGQPVSTLCLEMTEQHMIDDSDRTLQQLIRLIETGVGLAVDDFGTGYSSLAALHRLPSTTLKLDRSLVSNVGERAGDAVVAAVIGVAKAYGMSTVAEGVEQVSQARRLRSLGVDSLQGFLFARPEPLIELQARAAINGWCWDVDQSALDDGASRLPFDH